MLSQSDIIVRHGSLTERLAAAAPPQAEPTPTTMAERFAPEAQKSAGGADGPARPPAERLHLLPDLAGEGVALS